MSTQFQLRRGNTSQTTAFTGAVGELIADTQQNTLVLQDGVTQGGWRLASMNVVNTTFVQANAAFNAANSAGVYANSAYVQANASFSAANSSGVYANSAFSSANSAGLFANSAYVQANAAFASQNVTGAYANSAFNTANNAVPKSGGTMTGNLNVPSSNVIANNIQINNTLYTGVAAGIPTALPNLLAQLTGTSNNYVQINTQNLNPNGSSDYVVTADIGTDTIFYLDKGILGSQYNNLNPNNSIGTAGYALDGYLYVQGNTGQQGGNLIIGTTSATSGLQTRIIAGGSSNSNIVAAFDVNNTTINNNLVIKGNIVSNAVSSAQSFANLAYVKANAAYAQTNTALQNTSTISLTNNLIVPNNITFNSFTPGLIQYTVANGTISANNTDAYYNRFTGNGSSVFKLPDQTTIGVGTGYIVDPDCSGSITVEDSTGASVAIVPPGGAAYFYSMSNATSGGNWGGYGLIPSNVQWGYNGLNLEGVSVANANNISANSFTVNGLDVNTFINTVYSEANAAFAQANTALSTPQSSIANSSYSLSVASNSKIYLPVGTAGNSTFVSTTGNLVLSVSNNQFEFTNIGSLLYPDGTSQTTAYPGTVVYSTANSAGVYANSSFTTSNAAFLQANAAFAAVNGSSSYANSTFFTKSGGTIGGSISVQGDVNVTGNINYTGTVSTQHITGNTGEFFGYSNGYNALYAGLPSGGLFEPQTVFQVTSNFNGYSQLNMQNINSGNQSSSDYIVTADNGTANDGYLDLGMASSTYNYPGFTLIRPNDGYLITYGNTITGGGNTIISTGANNDIVFATGGVNTNNEVARFKYNTGLVLKQPITFADGTTQNSSSLSAGTYANAAFVVANASYSLANSVNTYASAAFAQSNAQNSYANTTFFTKSGGAIAGNITVTYNPSTIQQTAVINSAGANTKGGTGFVDFLSVTNQSAGAINPNKWFRLDTNGDFQIVNSAYSTTILQVSDTGVLYVPTVNINNVTSLNSSTYTSNGTSQVTVDTTTSSGYSVTKYVVHMYNTSSINSHAIELMVMVSQTGASTYEVYMEQYAEVLGGTSLTSLGSFDATYSAGTLSLLWTPTSSGTVLNFVRTQL